MTPPLEPARRMTHAGPPTPRKGWRCPRCGATGWSTNAHAAYLAGTRHYEETHDVADRAARAHADAFPADDPVDARDTAVDPHGPWGAP